MGSLIQIILVRVFTPAFEYLYTIMKTQTRLLAAVLVAMWALFNFIWDMMDLIMELLGTFDTITVVEFPNLTINMAYMSLLNVFVPLDLALTYFVGYVQLYIFCTSVRVVKAWIPTMN